MKDSETDFFKMLVPPDTKPHDNVPVLSPPDFEVSDVEMSEDGAGARLRLDPRDES